MSRIFFNVKACRKESHRDDFLDGRLYMNALGYFRTFEESDVSNIGDRFEGTIALFQAGECVITIVGDAFEGGKYTIPAEDFAGPSYIQNNGYNVLNVLCLYAVHEQGHTFDSDDEFERFVDAQMLRPEVDGLGPYAAIVIDTHAFQQRVLKATIAMRFEIAAGLVEYYDPDTFSGEFASAQAVFKKRNSFAHQREYRFSVDRGVTNEEAYVLDVGSIRDIAVGCKTDEVNAHLRDYLRQLRAQGVFGAAKN